MSRKKIILLILLVAIAAVGWYAWKEYSRTNKDLQKVKPDYVLTAAEILNEYESNDTAATKKYNGKVIELSGNVKTLEKDEQGFYTVVLGEGNSLSSVRCSMDSSHKEDAARLSAGTSTTVRCACTGFNKDEMGLGSDLILNRCAIIGKK
jgi:uncharacterized protein (DUF1330 family)